mgnify:CR=1 FL=1
MKATFIDNRRARRIRALRWLRGYLKKERAFIASMIEVFEALDREMAPMVPEMAKRESEKALAFLDAEVPDKVWRRGWRR